MKKVKIVSIVAMSIFYIWAGIQHFIDPDWFVQIMPPYLPFHYEAVYLSGWQVAGDANDAFNAPLLDFLDRSR